jgi:hypothetical protein
LHACEVLRPVRSTCGKEIRTHLYEEMRVHLYKAMRRYEVHLALAFLHGALEPGLGARGREGHHTVPRP